LQESDYRLVYQLASVVIVELGRT